MKNTLISSKACYSLEKRFKLILNERKLNQLIEDLNIRLEGTLSGTYTFTKEGTSLCNNAIFIRR